MVSKLHERLGTAGFVIAIVALIAAMSGGAYAASGGLSGKQKKEVEKIAKQYAGKPGKAGKNGTNGTNGTNGSNGSKGDAGSNGSNGANGAAGGQGIQGPPGETGFTEFLPSGKTETGVWGIFPNTPIEDGFAAPIRFNLPIEDGFAVPISFNIPLEEAPQAVLVKEGEIEVPGKCPGVVAGLPTAKPGFLCVYGDRFEGTPQTSVPGTEFFYHAESQGLGESGVTAPGATQAGVVFAFKCEAHCISAGSWAVTAK
jgi:hypothetical protein